MGRGMQIAVLSAAVGGSLAGGLTAVALAPADPAPAPVAPPVPPAVAPPTPSTDAATATPATPSTAPPALAAAMHDALSAFAGWARGHAGTACPELAALGAVARDPWGHALVLTCTDQPADQMAGVVSAGPDGALDTADDLASWELGRDVTDVVRGPRWKPSAAHASPRPGTVRAPGAPAARPARPAAPPPPPSATPAARDAGTDDIPAHR